jgi:hypothetical protein
MYKYFKINSWFNRLTSSWKYKALVSFFLCDFKEYKRNCKQVWKSDGVETLNIPPKNYSFIEKVIGRAPFGRLCNIADDEFCWYGHASSLLRFAGIRNYPIKKTTAEHGVILGERFAIENFDRYKTKLVLTYGQSRAKFLRSHYGINAESIGPFIHYANAPITDDQFSKLRKLLGRAVVHFPFFADVISSNSNLVAHSHDDHFLCAQTLLNWKKLGMVDSILICNRWNNEYQSHKTLFLYKKIGAIMIGCGSILNPFFLDHLKLIIELSTITTSNAVSTPLGYSIYLGKPHYIIGSGLQDPNLMLQQDSISKYLFKELYAGSEKIQFKLPYEDSYQIISEVFGFSSIKNSSELSKLILSAEKML